MNTKGNDAKNQAWHCLPDGEDIVCCVSNLLNTFLKVEFWYKRLPGEQNEHI